jgi:SAM-dependent methyltransferase
MGARRSAVPRVRGASRFAPPRVRGTEHLDDRGLSPVIALRSLADIRRCNRLFGGTAAVLDALRPALIHAAARGGSLSLLDVGTGMGDIPAAARALARRLGVALRTTGLEWTLPIARAAVSACETAVVGDARRLPFADGAFDLVTCSQVIHHLDDADAGYAISELHRVARRAVVIGELRRSWLAVAALWLASWPLAFHPVSRHDGVVSILRGFERDELEALVARATGRMPRVATRPAFRVSAYWTVA